MKRLAPIMLAAGIALGACDRDQGREPVLESTESLLNSQDVVEDFSYRCEDDSHVDIRYEQGQDYLVLFMRDRAVRLSQEVAASGAKYSGENITFWSKGEDAFLEKDVTGMMRCRLIEPLDDA